MAKGQLRSNREKKKPKTSTKKLKNKGAIAAAAQPAGGQAPYKFEPSRSGGKGS